MSTIDYDGRVLKVCVEKIDQIEEMSKKARKILDETSLEHGELEEEGHDSFFWSASLMEDISVLANDAFEELSFLKNKMREDIDNPKCGLCGEPKMVRTAVDDEGPADHSECQEPERIE